MKRDGQPNDQQSRIVHNLRKRLGNAITMLQAAPGFDGKTELGQALVDVGQLAQKLEAKPDDKVLRTIPVLNMAKAARLTSADDVPKIAAERRKK